MKICPNCFSKLDAETGIGHNDLPEHGDLTVCIYCQVALRFTVNMGLEQLTLEEFRELDNETQLKIAAEQFLAAKMQSKRFKGSN